jgi:hypothetical protein
MPSVRRQVVIVVQNAPATRQNSAACGVATGVAPHYALTLSQDVRIMLYPPGH